MDSVFQVEKITELAMAVSPSEKRSRRKSFDPSGELQMKKTTILTGVHHGGLIKRDRAGSTEEGMLLQNTLAEKIAQD